MNKSLRALLLVTLPLTLGTAHAFYSEKQVISPNVPSGGAKYSNFTGKSFQYMTSIDNLNTKGGLLKDGQSIVVSKGNINRFTFLFSPEYGLNSIEKTTFGESSYQYSLLCNNNEGVEMGVGEYDSEGTLKNVSYCLPESSGGTGVLNLELASDSRLHIMVKPL